VRVNKSREHDIDGGRARVRQEREGGMEDLDQGFGREELSIREVAFKGGLE
jgi:hypothetical protein